MRILVFFITCTLLLFTCRQDSGEPLFELNYPALDFSILAGQTPFISDVVQVSNIPSLYPSFIAASGQDPMDVNRVLPRFARLISLDGIEFSSLSSVSVRVCPNDQLDCTIADEVFFIDDLYRRRLSTINIDPGLADVKDILSSNLYKLEVVFNYAEITPVAIDCRLEYGFQAFK